MGLLGVTDATIEDGGEDRNALELVRSVSDKHLDLLRPSARYYSMFKGSHCVWSFMIPNEKGVSWQFS